MKGTLYGIGIGPGDPELITLKAVNILKKIDVVIAPRTQKNEKSTALNIAMPHLRQNTEILELVFPMVYDENQLNEAWLDGKNTILNLLEQGKQVAFLTLGDPMLYSTYIYIFRLLAPHRVDIQTIPGITSFCAAGSRLGYPLAEGNDIVSIIPATCGQDKLARALDYSDSVVLMKVYRNINEVVDQLKSHHLSEQAVMISKCGHPDETIHYQIDRSADLKPVYLSTILAKKRPEGVKVD